MPVVQSGDTLLGLDVVVVNYNGDKCLHECLSALSSAELKPETIWVVDNASTDGSALAAQSSFPDVRFLLQSENLGFAAANNVGITAAKRARWIACINPDAFVEPDWLNALVPYLEENSEFDFLSCQLIDASDSAIIDGAGDSLHVSGLVWRRLHQVSDRFDSIHPFFSPCGAAALYRKAAFDEVGGFDERYFCYSEDVDLGFRLRLAGYHGEHVKAARVRHVGSGITGKESDFTIYHGHRNLVWTYFKNMPTRLLWRYLPQHLLMNVISIAYYLAKGRLVILKAKFDALRGLAVVLHQRRGVIARIDHHSLLSHMARGVFLPYTARKE